MRLSNVSAMLLAGLLFFAIGCTKSDVTAGKGGTAILAVHPEYGGSHGGLINCTVFIKYNTTQAPADNIYDDSLQCTSVDSMVTGSFYDLQNGNYYLYARCYDTSFNAVVKGGTSFNISKQGITTDCNIPVMQ
jgi:hypothetical protein